MEIVIYIYSFILGIMVGSFLNVVIYRLPTRDESIVFPSSHCRACKRPIPWFDNIPILSYLLLKGKCRSCQAAISKQYPFVEFIMGVLSVALYVKFGLSFELLRLFIFAAALVAIIFIDIQHQIIPDTISLSGIVLGFASSFLSHKISWQESGLGILLGGGVLLGVAFIYLLLTKREGMGGGDIKLLAMIGAFLGWQSLLFIIFFSSVLGSIIGLALMSKQGTGSQTKIPYGPFLSIAALCYLFFEDIIIKIWHMYLVL